MTEAWRAFRLAMGDLWESSILVVTGGLFGGLASILLIPLPFVLAAHYGSALRLAEQRVATWRTWLADARQETSFFVKWSLLLAVTIVISLVNVYFYGQMPFTGAVLLRWLMALLLLLWLLPQPFVPAIFLQQEDRRLRTALRNAAVLVLRNPLHALLLWAGALLLAWFLAYIAWPLLGLLLPYLAIGGTRAVFVQLGREEA
ncbi:MAG: hypothetical protein RRC07_02870 [Anaerolineae bacterium]|nr:hypothetical protein [Anaerolineae bacterium]